MLAREEIVEQDTSDKFITQAEMMECIARISSVVQPIWETVRLQKVQIEGLTLLVAMLAECVRSPAEFNIDGLMDAITDPKLKHPRSPEVMEFAQGIIGYGERAAG